MLKVNSTNSNADSVGTYGCWTSFADISKVKLSIVPTPILIRVIKSTPTPMANMHTITCLKGKASKKISGINPQCPKGYKIKK